MDQLKQKQILLLIGKIELLTEYKEYFYNKFNYVEVLKKDIQDYLTDLKTITNNKRAINNINYIIHQTQTKNINRPWLDKSLQTIYQIIKNDILQQIEALL